MRTGSVDYQVTIFETEELGKAFVLVHVIVVCSDAFAIGRALEIWILRQLGVEWW